MRRRESHLTALTLYIDTFGCKSLCLVSYLGSVCSFWVHGVIFEKNVNRIWAVKPISSTRPDPP